MALEVRFIPPLALSVLLVLPLSPSPAHPQQSKARAESDASPEAKARLLQELDRQIEERRRTLAREEEELAALKGALEAAKTELLTERQRLEGLKRQVEEDLEKRGELSDERLDQVARVYQSMKPREAAQALEKMDDDQAVAILERLPNRAVGKLFDVMDKKRVKDLTRRLQEGRSGQGARGAR